MWYYHLNWVRVSWFFCYPVFAITAPANILLKGLKNPTWSYTNERVNNIQISIKQSNGFEYSSVQSLWPELNYFGKVTWCYYHEVIGILKISLNKIRASELFSCSSLPTAIFLTRVYGTFAKARGLAIKTWSVSFKVRLSPSPKKLFHLLQPMAFKNDEKCFLFHLKSFFHFQDI